MIIKVCMGSACLMKGSSEVSKRLMDLVNEHGLGNLATLKASHCMGPCCDGVVVDLDEKRFTGISMKNVDEFFMREVLKLESDQTL
ncbi:MAG: (2Fe-2S) ferredoxin domain-containing protein [Mesotoga sp.]|uniref:(2Fe-2S) ferredoxin domain-containing protein n=1 Tax=Mesotoga sp. TaxID=2053577 RepID=UPI00260F563C|nr:(2Fe-2S) ferredoxin domain-containing protein [Mesotoga sp.]MDD3682176.1 (2Fe-2S) ferredoxin domain-containing protein [Mesotoga sp.]